jgi:hypothetical protein
MTTMIQDKNGVIAAAPSSVPDRHFRDAWMFDSAQTAITEDITAAKVIFKDKIREARGPLLTAEDVTYMKALEANDSDAKVASVAKKVALRNAPAASAITNADTIIKLKDAWDSDVLGASPYK